MFAMSLPSQASGLIDAIRHATNYYSRVTAYAVGEGKVYASFNATSNNPAYTTPSSEAHTGEDGVSGQGNHTYYLYAQANEGNEFVGWYTDESCTNLASTANPYKASVSSQQGDDMPSDGTGADHRFYAKFVRETVSVKVTAAGYATFCSEYAVDFTNSGIEAYTLTIDGLSLNLNPITQVPANTGVVLKAEGGAEKDVPTISAIPAVTNNNLVGTNVALVLDENDYILNVIDGKAGFYRVATHPNLAAHRAYIPAASVPDEVKARNVKGFVFDEDDATGIETIENAVEDGAIYNMAGQRLNKMQKGINIVNGKKILKK